MIRAYSPFPSGFRTLLLLLLLLLVPVVLPAAGGGYDEDAVRLAIDESRSLLKSKNSELPELAQASERLTANLAAVRQCLASSKEELEKAGKALEALGPKSSEESSEVGQQRKNFRNAKADRQQELAECNLFAMQIEEISARINDRRQRLATLNILNKHDDLIALTRAPAASSREWLGELGQFFRQESGLEGLSAFALTLGGVTAGGVFLLGLWLRRFILLALPRFRHPILVALGHSLARYLFQLLPLLTLACLAQLVTSEEKNPTYLAPLALTSGLYLFLRLLIRFFIKPAGGNEPLLRLPPHLAPSFERYLKGAALLLCLNIFLAGGELFPKTGLPAFLLLRVTMVTLLCLLWIRLSWLLVQLPGRERSGRFLRLFLLPVLASAMLTAWLGYHNLSEYILANSLRTMGGLLLYFGVKYLLAAFFKNLSYGGPGWAERWRLQFGLGEGEVGTTFFWLHFLLDLLALALFILYAISSWSVSQTFTSQARTFLSEGFMLGQIPVAPGRIFIGIFIFFLLWTLSLWVKSAIKGSLEGNSHLTPSARDATLTLSGYLGFAFALLLGSGAAGVSFTSLAVIAGALSVGIGFGLQNIVNNFVSGLILIFERPIRRGDWIAVGATEGYVTEISVRSTVIRTFDRAEVIVPNSELISSQVTNWMFSDRKGRVKVPVGVAYGSDTALVKRLLLEAACAHPEVIASGGDLEPQVLFLSFGDNSLNFELRCFIHEIDKRLICRSDLNFAIDRIFREHQIVIPFPQRDINVKGAATPL